MDFQSSREATNRSHGECLYNGLPTSGFPSSRPPKRNQPASLDRDDVRGFLLQAVARAFEIEAANLLLPRRGNAAIARARQVLMYLAHVGCGLTLTEVGRMFNRDRTTVAHACHVVEDCREDLAFDRAIELLEFSVGLVTAAPPEGSFQ